MLENTNNQKITNFLAIFEPRNKLGRKSGNFEKRSFSPLRKFDFRPYFREKKWWLPDLNPRSRFSSIFFAFVLFIPLHTLYNDAWSKNQLLASIFEENHNYRKNSKYRLITVSQIFFIIYVSKTKYSDFPTFVTFFKMTITRNEFWIFPFFVTFPCNNLN